MPKKIQTLAMADALTRMGRLQGRVLLELDEDVVAAMSVDLTRPPFHGDGHAAFCEQASSAANVGFTSHVGIRNTGGGVVIVDQIILRSSANRTYRVCVGRDNFVIGDLVNRVTNVSQPFLPQVAGTQRLPPEVCAINTGAGFGGTIMIVTLTANTTLVLEGPWVLPGRQINEELVVRPSLINVACECGFIGRWYPGLTPKA